MPKADKPTPPMVTSLADIVLLAKISGREPFDLVGLKFQMKVKRFE